MNHTQKPLEIGMLLYPRLTLLDLIGPQTVFSWFANIHLVWKTTDLIRTDTGIWVKPNATFATCPRELDILFVPGGFRAAKSDGRHRGYGIHCGSRRACQVHHFGL